MSDSEIIAAAIADAARRAGAHDVGDIARIGDFSKVTIESSGGTDPIQCEGHTKGDAVKMKALIEQYQTDYYRSRSVPPIT